MLVVQRQRSLMLRYLVAKTQRRVLAQAPRRRAHHLWNSSHRRVAEEVVVAAGDRALPSLCLTGRHARAVVVEAVVVVG